MVDGRWQGRLRLAGLIPVVIIAVLAVFLALLGFRGPVFDTPDLALVLQFLFVFCVSIILAVVSAKAYLISGSFSLLLLGIAPMMSGTLLMVAQWAVTPSLGSTLTPNAAVTIGNLGILIASCLLMVGAILLYKGREHLWPDAPHKIVLGGLFLAALVIIVTVVLVSISGSLPVFFTSSGSTAWRQGVLSISGVFLAISCGLFGWTYFRTRSPTVYWYTLGFLSFATALIGIVFTVKIGEAVNWCGRLGLYLSGLWLLMAVLSRNTIAEKETNLSERWADAFANDRNQLTTFYSRMLNGFAYCKIVTDRSGRPIDYTYLDVNPAFERNHGLKKEDIIGRRATVVQPGIENDSLDLIARFGRIALNNDSTEFEAYSTIENKWFHFSAYSPKKGYFVLTSEDITDRKKAEEELKQSEQRFRTSVEDMPDALGIFTAVRDERGKIVDFRVEYVNNEACRLNFMTREQQVGHNLTELFPGFSKLSIFHDYIRTVDTGEPMVANSYDIEEAYGGGRRVKRAYDFRGRRLGDGFVVVWRDVTESKQMEEEIRRSNDELMQFAYLASHDLQEPLRMVISYLSLLDRNYRDELDHKAKEYIDYALNGGNRMRQLIDDLLEYSRIDTRAKEFALVDMKEVVESSIKMLKVQIDESKADIYIGPMPMITVDGSQLGQVMQNLISNSLKFRGPERPMVHISASEGMMQWTFSVKDNGIGLNVEYAERIFQMFQRLHTQDQYPGTGVGLAIVKKIVERHGGRIWVESVEGKGATFFFTVPKAGKH